jgi:hypothetical protein
MFVNKAMSRRQAMAARLPVADDVMENFSGLQTAKHLSIEKEIIIHADINLNKSTK